MQETTIKNAKEALAITTTLTLFAAGFEVFMAYSGYRPGMNIFDIASYATANINVYCLVLILINLILLPSAVLLYKQNNISLKNEIVERKTLGKDICKQYNKLYQFPPQKPYRSSTQSVPTLATKHTTVIYCKQ